MTAYDHNWTPTSALLKSLWPTWEPTVEQAGIWKHQLGTRKHEQVLDAIRKHYVESTWREPCLADVLGHIRVLNAGPSIWTAPEVDDAATPEQARMIFAEHRKSKAGGGAA